MTTTLEKVGLAICSPTGHVPCKEVCGECNRRARAAIQALMKPPSEEMLQRGGRLVALWADELPQDSDHEELARDCWDAMLQAILDEQKETA